ncbi:uncharacterized protein METZ01_LOCUS276152, partial [marine metagenome]
VARNIDANIAESEDGEWMNRAGGSGTGALHI